MSIETVKALTYQECAYLHILMRNPAACTLEALRQSYQRLLVLFDLLSQFTSEERAEALLVFTYCHTFAGPQPRRVCHE